MPVTRNMYKDYQMAYRLISKANLSVTHLGAVLATEVGLRAYPAPKRAASGNLSLNGFDVEFRRTGGKGRGLLARNYIYFTLNGDSAYCEVTEAQALAITAGGAIKVDVTAGDAIKTAEPVQVSEPVTTEADEPSPAPKAARRSRK